MEKLPENLWECPKCDMMMTQPSCVVAVSHRCRPTSSQTAELKKVNT